MGRLLEVKEKLIVLKEVNFVNLDDVLVDLKLTPDVLEVPVPKFFREDQERALEEREKLLDVLQLQAGIDPKKGKAQARDDSMTLESALRVVRSGAGAAARPTWPATSAWRRGRSTRPAGRWAAGPPTRSPPASPPSRRPTSRSRAAAATRSTPSSGACSPSPASTRATAPERGGWGTASDVLAARAPRW